MPVDEFEGHRIPRIVNGSNFSKVFPTPIEQPYIGSMSKDCLKMIGLGDYEKLDQSELAQYLSGVKLFEGSKPISHCYAGY